MASLGVGLGRPLPSLAKAAPSSPATASTPILDTHIHLFDPKRPGGVPWPPPGDLIYRQSLPADYELQAKRLGVVGAIAIEASPLASDNDWLLRTVEASPYMVGMVGDLEPTSSSFGPSLERLQRNPLFLGIRHGNLWNRSLSDDLKQPSLIPALAMLEQAGLVLETANPDLPLLRAILHVAGRLPSLTIVIDHLPHMEEPATEAEKRDVQACLTGLGKAPKVFVKLSEIPRTENGVLLTDPNAYRSRLDLLWDTFGPDRVLFGSDWPNSDHVASLSQTFALVRAYMSAKTVAERRKFFFNNSHRAYRWRPREQNQVARLLESPTSPRPA